MDARKPYAKPVVKSISRQEFCAHCIDQTPIGTFRVDGAAFALCWSCSTYLKLRKCLPPIRETGMSLALFNTATHIPGLDTLDRWAAKKARRRGRHPGKRTEG
jgi:hypothetical protein